MDLREKQHAVQVPEEPKRPIQPNVFGHRDAFLLVVLNTLSELIFKTMTAFVVYIMVDYGFSYSFTISAISTGALSTASSFILIPLVLHLPANVVFCLSSLLLCASCFLLWFWRHNHVTFVIAIILESLAQNAIFGCSNAVIATFVSDSERSHKYLSAVNSGWTIATFLFFGVGYVMKIGSFWLFLEMMFAVCFFIAILSLLFLPKQSTNDCNSDHSESGNVSIRNDLAVIAKIQPFWLINMSFILIFTAWGFFYSSFGLWLKELFHLSQEEFGYIAGLCEGIGNALGIFTVTYLGKSNQNDPSWYKVSLQSMMCWCALIGTASLVAIWCINFMEWYHKGFCYLVIGIFFYGQEACVCAGLVLMNNVIPPLRQGRAFSFIGIVQSFTVFTAQMTVSKMYAWDGMQLEAGLLSLMYALAVLDLTYMLRIMRKRPIKEEIMRLLPDGDDSMPPRYT